MNPCAARVYAACAALFYAQLIDGMSNAMC